VRAASAVVVALTAFVFGFHKLDDFDTWWHLATGRWIVTHTAIPRTDVLSHTVPDHAWINLQWGFDVGLFLLHRVGGPALLCLAGALTFLAAVALLLRVITRQTGAVVAGAVVLLVTLAAQERVTLRPELLSFLLLAAVLAVLEHGRRTNGRGLFLLVPLMLVWVNVHSLFVVGAFAIVCAWLGGGTAPSRRLLIWGGTALAAVLINPFGLDGLLFPLKLVSRIDGSSTTFQTVGEFGSPWAAGATGVSVVVYKVWLALICVLALAAFVVSRRPARGKSAMTTTDVRFDWGGLIFVAGLAALSMSARRNIAIFAIGSAPFAGRCIELLFAARPRWQQAVTRRASLVAAMTMAVAVTVSGAVMTGAFYKFDNSPQEFGAGVIEGTFPIRAAAFAKAAALPGKLYNDMGSGGYLTWDAPVGGGVFVDGRLEVYDTAFITDYVTGVAVPSRWQADADRYRIQTAIIFHRFENDRVLTGRLFQDPAWSLVYVDEVAAIFVRTQGNADAISRASSLRAEWDQQTSAWLARPAQRWPYPAGRIEGTRAYARVLATIGRGEPAIAAYLKLVELGIPPAEEVERRLMLARYFAARNRTSEAREQAQRVLAIDSKNEEALRLVR
jgi:hypothetical protein